MKAAVWYEKHDIRIERSDDPSSPAADEVIVAPALGGICGTDLHEYLSGPHFIPRDASGKGKVSVLGHEFCGTVVEVGAEVSGFKAGDRVAVHPAIYCGTCRYCQSGTIQLCPTARWIGLGADGGGLSTRVRLKAFQLYPLPDHVTFEQGALVEPAAVTLQAVTRGGVQEGDVVLVTGGGPIGQLAAMNARAAGARAVYLSEVVPFRRELALSNAEPTAVIDPSRESIPDILRDVTGGFGADVAIECSGNERALMDALAATRRDGTVVQLAIFLRAVTLHPADHITLQAKRLVGSLGYSGRDYERVIGLIASGKLPVERLVTAVIELEDLIELGIDELIRPDTQHVKILVRPTPDA